MPRLWAPHRVIYRWFAWERTINESKTTAKTALARRRHRDTRHAGLDHVSGADFKNKSKLEQQELALLGPGLDALMSGDMVTYRKLGAIYRQLERKRKASKRKKKTPPAEAGG